MKRFALSIGHLVVDVLLLVAFMQEGRNMWNSSKASTVRTIAFQEEVLGEFEVMSYDGPPRSLFWLMCTGALPAGVVSYLWDPIWFAIHEAVALPLWYFIGTSRFLMVRSTFAGIAIACGGGPLFSLLQIGYWIVLGGASIVRLIRRSYSGKGSA
jgi:hypothetical protein